MAFTNNLKKQVDMPVWEWCRFAPVASTGNLGCACSADNSNYHPNFGRYIYNLINATNFWRYDTWSDTWQQLASPLNATVTSASMRFTGSMGYINRVISATSTTIQTGLPYGGAAIGYKIRIISGRGAGQERVITDVADPVVADYGAATAGAVTSLTDTTKTWTNAYVGTSLTVNKWVGYSVRIILGTGVNQVRKILYSSTTALTIGDVNKHPEDPWCHTTWVAPVAGTLYQIESSVITVDTAWTVTPDSTSRFAIQAGGIFLLSGAGTTPFFTMQYYDVLADVWYVKPALSAMMAAAPTDLKLERMTENSTIWEQSVALGTHSATTLQDTTKNWTVNQYAGYYVFIYSGTGVNQISAITSNTATTLTLASTLGTPPDNTSKYQITGYDAGTATSSAAFNTITDSGKAWETNRWANFAVRILAGTGVGQVRAIVSNTATTLTLYRGWTVQPDNTSIYAIQGDPNTLFITWGGSAETFIYQTSEVDQLSHGRVLDSGVACTMAALLTDVNHVIYEQAPIAIATITNVTTTATATTVNPHNLQVGQYVSIRGATGADAQFYDGRQLITTVPSTTTFTFTMSGTPAGSAAGVGAQTTTVVFDGSKDHRQVASGGVNGASTITFAANTPSNINGYWLTGTGVGAGARVVSGAGTTTLTVSVVNSGTVSGIIVCTQWAPSVTATFSSGGTIGLLTVTVSANTPSYINGWYVTGTNVGLGATVVSGAGTTNLVLSVVHTGTISGTLTFSFPWGNTVLYGNSNAVAVTTGATTGQAMQATVNTGNSVTVITAMAAALTAGVSRYVIAKREVIGAGNEGTLTNYNSGLATGGSVTTVIDANAFWTVTGNSGVAQTTTITLGTAAPAGINGWYLTAGTGINVGAQVVSGAGTTTLTMSVANSGTVSGSLTFCAWNTNLLINKRIKFLTGATGGTQELIITAVTATTGTITFGSAVAPINGVTSYSIIAAGPKGTGHSTEWASGLSDTTKRGKFMYISRAGATAGFDRIDLTTDRVTPIYTAPATETLTTGTMYVYDGGDRIYFTKDATQRVYYLDLEYHTIHGAGLFPYTAPTATLGSRMEIFTTSDGLRYMWIQRQSFTEAFRQLLFY